MLPRRDRIDGATFSRLPTGGQRYVRSTVQVRHVPAACQQAAVVVSRKVSTKAVERNRLRRVLYGVLERVWSDLPTGYYLVYVQPTAKGERDVRVSAELKSILGEMVKAR